MLKFIFKSFIYISYHDIIFLWKNVFWIVIKEWNSNMCSFKWLEIWYVYSLYMCELLEKLQDWIFICFIWIKFEKKHTCQNFIYKTIWFNLYMYNLWHILAKCQMVVGWQRQLIVSLETNAQTLILASIYIFIQFVCWSYVLKYGS